MLREILLRHTRAIQDPAKMLAEARQLLAQLPHEEAASLLEQDDDILFHDDLAPINHPVWFHEFAAHAARHKLQYLGEADPHEMFDPREIPASTLLDREQYLDFLKLRRFRQTLLCRSEVRLTHNANATDMDRFLFSANPHGRRLPGEDRAVEAVVQAIDDAAPLPLEFDDLVPYAGSPAALREILFSLTISGCVDLNVYAFPCQEEVTTRPRASRLARYQAVESSIVTNACHIPVQLDPAAHKLLLRLDGSRTRSTLARHRGTLSWLARMALLE
jgi:hypothetical protein